jgi:hypothetical protein
MTLPPSPIAEEFSPSGLAAAIRGAQTDTIRYPEFVKRSTAARVVAYWSFLTGRKVGLLRERVRLFGGAQRDNLSQTKDDCVCGEQICPVLPSGLRVEPGHERS